VEARVVKTLNDRTPPHNGPASGLLTVEECAAFLRVKPQTIRLWVCTRRIPCYKIGRCVRFMLAEIETWLAQQKREPASFYENQLSTGTPR
jgi:excisionase family DNA binding protein